MKKKLTLLWLLFVLTTGVAMSQTREVSGVVISKDQTPLIGVSIQAKGQTQGAVTDANGKFSISVPPETKNLVVRYIGYVTQEIELGASNTVNVVLEDDLKTLNQVTVTALGVKADRDKQGSSTSNVSGLLVQKSGESGLLQGLSGKAAGVQITRNNGDPGAGANILIRGQSTITGNLQPLIVVDGVPINSSNIGSGTLGTPTTSSSNFGNNVDGVAQQSRINDLNPDDIESIEILKGAAASAIYGTRAANGVVVITTKRAKYNPDKNVSVSYRTSFMVDKINREYEKQSTFGQGSGGNFSPTTGLSWGDKISSRSGSDSLNTTGAKFVADDGSVYYPVTHKGDQSVYNKKNRDQIFRNGLTWENSINVGIASNESTNTFISISDWNQKGIMRGNSDYRRTTVRANFSTILSKNVKFGLNTYYAKINSNRIQQGSNVNGLYLGYLRTSPDFDNEDYKGTYYDANGIPSFNAHRGYRRHLGNFAPTYNNPGWTLNEQINTSEVDRFLVNPEINYDWAPNSRLTMRMGIDQSSDRRNSYFPYNSAGDNASGKYEEDRIIEGQNTYELFSRTTNTLSPAVNLTWTVGTSLNNRKFSNQGGQITNFLVIDNPPLDLNNATSTNTTVFDSDELIRTSRGYAIFDFGIYDKIFVSLTGAAEASNTFVNRIFYPSASVAYQFTKDFFKASNIISFGKVRASYGTVGVQPPAYISGIDYVNGVYPSGYGENLDGSLFGGTIVRGTIQGNPDIKPERKTEFEFGTDLRLINNRIGLNFTYYQNKTKDAIFDVDVPASTGFKSKWENAAVISNKGLELELSAEIISTKDFRFGLNGNLSRNRNKVEDLKDVKSIFLAGFEGASSRAVEGEALGALWGGKFDRDASGNMILDENGFPTQALEEGVIGDPNPKYRAGFGFNTSYKGLTLSVLFETCQGNDMWAGTSAVLTHFGIDPETANEQTASKDLKTYDGGTIKAGETFRGNIHDFGHGDVALTEAWYTSMGGGFGPVAEQFIVDGSWTKLREVTLSYLLPKKLIEKTKLGGIEISFTGRNLMLWTKFKGNDPEMNLTGVTNGRGLDYFTNPGTRSFIGTLKVTF